uniref:Uncharacterized protein n=1 Tax=Panagrellus redivivus TaxID=6233 RepID=A0A7E4VLB3_PANRE
MTPNPLTLDITEEHFRASFHARHGLPIYLCCLGARSDNSANDVNDFDKTTWSRRVYINVCFGLDMINGIW